MYAKLNASQINLLKIGRDLDAAHRSRIRSEIFAAAKAAFGIPAEHRLKVEIDNVQADDYGVLRRKKNGQPYEVPSATVPLTAPTPVTPPPPPKRWFKIDVDGVVEGYIDSFDWDDGRSDMGDESFTIAQVGDYSVCMTSDALYVQLTEDQLF